MEYSIQQLARLSGVSARTLRWYDQIDLLKPRRVAENGYRYYGGKEVDRLQDILYYRALGIKLEQIKKCLNDPSFDRLTALYNHLNALKAEQKRLEILIQSVKDTIEAERRKEAMKDEKKFEAFKKHAVQQNEKNYGTESRAKYGDAQVDEANAAIMNLTQEQYLKWTGLDQQIHERLQSAVRAGICPHSEEGKEITALHRQWLTIVLKKQYSPEKHRKIAQLYIMDERFANYYDKQIPGCASFLQQAIAYWAN